MVHGLFGNRAVLCANSHLRWLTTCKRTTRRDQVTVQSTSADAPDVSFVEASPMKLNDKQMGRMKIRCWGPQQGSARWQICCGNWDQPTRLLVSARPAWPKWCPWVSSRISLSPLYQLASVYHLACTYNNPASLVLLAFRILWYVWPLGLFWEGIASKENATFQVSPPHVAVEISN